MEAALAFDVAVVGSGQGGVPLARAFAARGKRVVIFEAGDLGGTCVNTGCTPSKALLASAHAAGRARRAARIGVHADVRVDAAAVLERVRATVAEWRRGVDEQLTTTANLTLVRAEASFDDARTLRAAGRSYTAETIVLDTGGAPILPPIEGIEGVEALTSSTIWRLTDRPEHLVVLGGGYIGMELGQGFARLGSAVTIVSPDDRVMPREELDVCAVLTRALRADGIDLRLGCRPVRADDVAGEVRITLDDGSHVQGDALLVAAGRRPVVPRGAQEAGIALDGHGYVAVDAQLRTSLPHVFALGDCAGQPQFTHVAWEDHRRILDVIDGGSRTRDDRLLAYAAYTEPQIGRVGMEAREARAAGHDTREMTLPLDRVARAVEWDVEDGFLRLVCDATNDRILGATFCGYECAELVQVVHGVAQMGGTWRDLERTVFIHPTLAEGIASLARLFA